MIAYPIGDPIGCCRVRPNRPRIARPVPSRPLEVSHLAYPTYERPNRPLPTHLKRQAAMR